MEIQEQTNNIDTSTDLSSSDNTSTEVPQTENQDPLGYEKGVSLSEKIDKNPNALQQLVDLDKVEKFRWNGREYTRDALKKEIMLHKDYTQKTQKLSEEKKFIEERKKYDENLYHDLEKVKANPALVEEFKKIYPEFYHKLVDFLQTGETIKKDNPAAIDETKVEQKDLQDPRVDEVYNWVTEQKLKTAEVEVNALFDKMSTKYPEASEREVIGQVQHLLALHRQSPRDYKKPDDKTIEDLFKTSQEDFVKRADARHSKRFNDQKAANAKGSGPGAGGGVPGAAPKVARNIKEATALALQDPGLQ